MGDSDAEAALPLPYPEQPVHRGTARLGESLLDPLQPRVEPLPAIRPDVHGALHPAQLSQTAGRLLHGGLEAGLRRSFETHRGDLVLQGLQRPLLFLQPPREVGQVEAREVGAETHETEAPRSVEPSQ